MTRQYKKHISKLKYSVPDFLNPLKVPTLSHNFASGLLSQGGSIADVVPGNPANITDKKTAIVLNASAQFTNILDTTGNIWVINDSNNGYANSTLPANIMNGVVSFTIMFAIKTPATGISKTIIVTYNPAGVETMEIAITNAEKIRCYINDGTNHIDLIGPTETYADSTWRVMCFQWNAVNKTVTIRTPKETLSQTNALIGTPVFYSTTRKTPFGCYMTNAGVASNYSRSYFSDVSIFSSLLNLITINQINKFMSLRLNIPFHKLL